MMKRSTKLKIAIDAIEHRQRYYVFNANVFKRQGFEFGRKAAEHYDRLEEAKRFLQDMLQEST